MSVWAQATDNDVLEGGVDDLVVVGNAVELLSLQVEEHMMTLQHAVSVGMCVVPPTCSHNHKQIFFFLNNNSKYLTTIHGHRQRCLMLKIKSNL